MSETIHDIINRDIAELRQVLPAIGGLADHEIEELYAGFSGDMFCAGWMGLDSVCEEADGPGTAAKTMVQMFGEWLARKKA